MWYKNIRAQNLLIILFSIVGMVCSMYLVNLTTAISLDERRQIEEEVFSAFFDYITNHPQANPDYLFMSVSGEDPVPSVVNHFKHHVPIAEPISNSTTTFGFSASVVHKSDTEKKGIIVDLEVQDKRKNGDVIVQSYVYKNRGISASYQYTLTKHDGVYRVHAVQYPDLLKFD